MKDISHQMLDKITVPLQYNSLFQDAQQTYHDSPWLSQLRKNALDSFLALGEIPSVKQEYWKYTNLSPLKNQHFLLSTPRSISQDQDESLRSFLGDSVHAYPIRVYEGSIQEPLASLDGLPQGVTLTTLVQILQEEPDFLKDYFGTTPHTQTHAFVALNTAFFRDALVLRVREGVKVSVPIVVTLTALLHEQPYMWYPRILIVLEERSEVTFIEHHTSVHEQNTYFSNSIVEIHVGKDASLIHYKLQQESRQAFHIAHTTVQQREKSTYRGFTLNMGGWIARNEVHTVLDGVECECSVNGAYLVRGQQHIDVTSVINHRQPWCRSRQVYKGVVADQGQAVFQGKIAVASQAQKTDGYQLNQTLLLSEKAQINTKPELEIFADDVKCSHGATTGALDDDALFYLRARGIEQGQAKNLLITAFLEEALLEIPQQDISTVFHNLVEQWLRKNSSFVSPEGDR